MHHLRQFLATFELAIWNVPIIGYPLSFMYTIRSMIGYTTGGAIDTYHAGMIRVFMCARIFDDHPGIRHSVTLYKHGYSMKHDRKGDHLIYHKDVFYPIHTHIPCEVSE